MCVHACVRAYAYVYASAQLFTTVLNYSRRSLHFLRAMYIFYVCVYTHAYASVWIVAVISNHSRTSLHFRRAVCFFLTGGVLILLCNCGLYTSNWKTTAAKDNNTEHAGHEAKYLQYVQK